MADLDELLAQYTEARGRGDFPSFLPLPPLRRPAEVRNLGPRPADAMTPVAETLSPTMGAYGVGSLAGDTYLKAREGDITGVASNLPGLALAAAPIPGAKRVPRIETPIRAYHGSPHDFDKFDLSKIGTGEGAQAYGHGLYFAEAEPVARQYRDKLADRPAVRVGGEEIKPTTDIFAKNSADATVAARLSSLAQQQGIVGNGQMTPASAIAKVKDDIEIGIGMAQRRGDFDLWRTLSDQKLALQRFEEQGIDFGHKGKMYEVALHATPEQFLDWDKPLSGQSPAVQAAMSKAAGRELPLDLNGQNAWERVWTASGDTYSGAGRNASGRLSDAGIPGIRYLDQGSRSAGQGTSNFVVWSPEIIEILRKYGIAAPVAAPTLAGALSQYGGDDRAP